MEDDGLAPAAVAPELERETSRFIALFLLGCVLFSPLLMSVFDAPGAALFGIPLLFVYLFASWAVLIGLAAWLSQRVGDASAPVPVRSGSAADGG